MSDSPVFNRAELPHAGPMRWVDSVAPASNPGESIARATLPPNHPFVVDGLLLRSALIELMAQGAAAGASLRAASPGKPARRGMLVAIKELEILEDAPANTDLEIHTRKEAAFGALSQSTIEVRHSGRLVARGRMTFHR